MNALIELARRGYVEITSADGALTFTDGSGENYAGVAAIEALEGAAEIKVRNIYGYSSETGFTGADGRAGENMVLGFEGRIRLVTAYRVEVVSGRVALYSSPNVPI